MAAASAATTTRAALPGLALLLLLLQPSAGALGDSNHSSEPASHHHHQHVAAQQQSPVLSQPHSSRSFVAASIEHEPQYNHPSGTQRGTRLGSHLTKTHDGHRSAVKIKPKTSTSSMEAHDTVEALESKHNENNGSFGVNNHKKSSKRHELNASHTEERSPLTDMNSMSEELINPPAQNVRSAFNVSECQTCRHREEIRNFSLQLIKQQILDKLGIKHPPNTTGREVPKIMIDHFLSKFRDPGIQADQPYNSQEGEDDDKVKTSMIIAVARTSKLRHGGGIDIGNDLDIQHFRFSEQTMRKRVANATMFVWVPEMPRPIQVRVYKIVGNATEKESMITVKIAESKIIEHRQPNWVEIEVRKLINEWFKSPSQNLGVVLHLEENNGKEIPYSVEVHSENEKQPFVKIHTKDVKKLRNQRSLSRNCAENSQEVHCCRYPLIVDFEEFGWEWIIAPKRYAANYCSGDCPYLFYQKYPHAHVVQQAIPAGTAGPCCAPSKMSGISMLYSDNESNIILGALPGMIVEKCACQ